MLWVISVRSKAVVSDQEQMKNLCDSENLYIRTCESIDLALPVQIYSIDIMDSPGTGEFFFWNHFQLRNFFL